MDAVIITSVSGSPGKQGARHFTFPAFLLASFHKVEIVFTSRDSSLCSETWRLNSTHRRIIITLTLEEMEMHNHRGIKVCTRRVQVKPRPLL
jgi:hypothetical protein